LPFKMMQLIAAGVNVGDGRLAIAKNSTSVRKVIHRV
jgi:hypothetical protein